MRVAVGSDEAGPLVDTVVEHLRARGHTPSVLACGEAWPLVGRSVAEAVARGDADLGVVCCWTGTGVSIAANKVRGVRAALCTDAVTAAGARRWNDANVLALSLRLSSAAVVGEILAAFLETPIDATTAIEISGLEISGLETGGR